MTRLGDVYFRNLGNTRSKAASFGRRSSTPNVSQNSTADTSTNGPGAIARIVYKLGSIGVSIGENVKRASDQFTEFLSNIPFGPIGIAEKLLKADSK